MTGAVEARLAALGLSLPAPLVLPSANRTSAVFVPPMLDVSGHGTALPEDAGVVRRGRIGSEVSEAEGYATARALALKMPATVKRHSGDLDRLEKLVKLTGFIHAEPDFERHNQVLDGASDLFFAVLGPAAGQHARCSRGVAGLVARQPVEIEATFLVRAAA